MLCQKHQLMEAVAREEFLVPSIPTCVSGSPQQGLGTSGPVAHVSPERCWRLVDRSRTRAVNTP